MRIKIYGAGSIGNHLTEACRHMGWDVVVVDPDPTALRRMQNEVYPARYGEWDDDISLHVLGEEPWGGFDMIFLGTPPDVRTCLALDVIPENPRLILLEKPICAPNNLSLMKNFDRKRRTKGIAAFVGYDHAVSESMEFVYSLIREGAIGDVHEIHVEFREHWGGIFAAHPWLSGPKDSYLGFTDRGGGASGEHSHALHLWYTLSQVALCGPLTTHSGDLIMTRQDGACYDERAEFHLESESGVKGRVSQDVTTKPAKKQAVILGSKGSIKWRCSAGSDGEDIVVCDTEGSSKGIKIFHKDRRFDFHWEAMHLERVLNGEILEEDSPIGLVSGIVVMDILAGAKHHYPSF